MQRGKRVQPQNRFPSFPLSRKTSFISHDKRRARINAWRAPEKSLHLFELAGGWPGAFLAQRQLRHKVSKLGFQFVFWLIVALHQFVAIDFLLGWQMWRALASIIGPTAR